MKDKVKRSKGNTDKNPNDELATCNRCEGYGKDPVYGEKDCFKCTGKGTIYKAEL